MTVEYYGEGLRTRYRGSIQDHLARHQREKSWSLIAPALSQSEDIGQPDEIITQFDAPKEMGK